MSQLTNNSPAVSVIIGAYNCSDTIAEALDSIYAQTFQDFEVIVCNDGSTDDTFAILQSYQKSHPRLRLLANRKNMGLAFTLNQCLSVAKGKYVARMDADDRSRPDRLAMEYQFMESHPEYAVVSCRMALFDSNGIFRITKEEGEVTKFDFVHGSPFNHAASMMHRDALVMIGGYNEDKRYLRVEDYHLWFNMYANGLKGYNLTDIGYEMRDEDAAMHRRDFSSRLRESALCLRGFYWLKLPLWTYIWCLKPIITALLPRSIYKSMHRHG